MIIELIIAIIIGIIAGTFTGLAPGIHINLIASILLSSLSYFAGVPVIVLAVFIVSMSITHTFLDFIPSVFLGAPDEDTFLSILPGHELAMQGKGYEAVILTLYGSIGALIIILFFTPLFVFFLPSFYLIIKSLIPFVLIFISAYIIFREENILLSLTIFLISGFLGLAAFNSPIKEPLLPLLAGLFGLSNLVISIKQKTKLKKQIISPLSKIKLSRKELTKSFSAAFIFAPLCSFLPGIGSGHAATLGSELIPQERRGFLFLVGAINTIVMALSFVTVYAISKGRSGSAVAVQTLLKEISIQNLLVIMATIIFSGVLSFFLGIFLAKAFAKNINKINYQKLNLSVIILLILANLVFTNWLGLIVLIGSTTLGIYTILSGIRRINLMACLIMPSVIYYII